MTEEVRLVIPAEEDFRPIAHLVTGGVALRLDVTYDQLEDLHVALEALLGLRDDEDDVIVTLAPDGAALRMVVGPFASEALRGLEEEGGDLGLRRVLETVTDSFEVEERAEQCWVELTKGLPQTAEAAG
jgi:hypothetical protein